MNELTVTAAVFEARQDADYPLRIWVAGSGFAHISGQVAAVVGDVPVRWIVHNPDAGGFSGLLGSIPAEGARLRVGWLGMPMADTDVTFASEVS